MRSVTPKDKVAAFTAVTPRFYRDNQHRFEEGMSDVEIEHALKDQFGDFGSRGGPGQLHITYQGAGLKLWVSWHIHNYVREEPALVGAVTIAMAREIYGITNSDDRQMDFFWKSEPCYCFLRN